MIHDSLGRPLRDVRISLTSHCNLRCTYCMPKSRGAIAFTPPESHLSFDEIERLVDSLCDLGLRKVKLTGGEPLLRPRVPELIARLRARHPELDIGLITNGVLLPEAAADLKAAGLSRVTVSLDALRPEQLDTMSGRGALASRAHLGIDAALAQGFSPVKVNMVVIRGVNDGDVLAMAAHFRNPRTTVRFIEYMDVGTMNRWRREQVVPSAEILARLRQVAELVPVTPAQPGETATRYRYTDGTGEVGFISSVTQPFCGDCNRLRVTAEGQAHTCLFSPVGTDLRPALYPGNETQLRDVLRGLWSARRDRYSMERASAPAGRKLEMFAMGG